MQRWSLDRIGEEHMIRNIFPTFLLLSAGGYRGHGAGAEQAGPGGRGRVPLHRPERRPVTRQQEDHGPCPL